MPDVSFLIPTNRPHHSHLNNVIESVKRLDSLNFTYEFLVCSPHYDKDTEDVFFFKDYSNRGSILPINLLAEKAKGDFLTILTDDYLPSTNFFNIYNFLLSDTFSNRKFKITSPSVSVDGRVSAPPIRVPPSVPHPRINEEVKHNRPYIMRFPTLTKETYKLLGSKIFHPHFIHHAADNYLSLYLNHMGEDPIEFSDVFLFDWKGRNSKTDFDVHETVVLFHLMKNINDKYFNDYPEDIIQLYKGL